MHQRPFWGVYFAPKSQFLVCHSIVQWAIASSRASQRPRDAFRVAGGGYRQDLEAASRLSLLSRAR